MDVAVERPVDPRPDGRPPSPSDCLLFFGGLPLGLAFFFSLVGVRLVDGLGWITAWVYLCGHMAVCWWVSGAGTWAARRVLAPWRPGLLLLCAAGYTLALVPGVWLMELLGDHMASHSATLATNRGEPPIGLSLDYAMHFIEGTAPGFLLFTTGLVCYTRLTGVRWLDYDDPPARTPPAPAVAPPRRPRAGLLAGSSLPADAEIVAIRAQQHYVRIWSTDGRDLVRLRMADVDAALAATRGGLVHRSWWVNFDRVRQVRRAGRSVTLEVDGGLSVPVSLSRREAVLDALDR